METHDMHPEFIEVSIAFIEALRNHLMEKKSPVIAVGTTSVRTIESLYWIGVRIMNNEQIDWNSISVPQWYPYEQDTSSLPEASIALTHLIQYLQNHNIPKLVTRTQIIIAPGYTFRIIQNIVTNFHQPQSTLLLLIAAFIGDKWKDMYNYALANNYRFLSYGDGCIL